MSLNAIVPQFLLAIQGVESAHNTMLSHPEVKQGLQAGSRAIGRYAVMPNTIMTLSRNPASIEHYKNNSDYELKLASKYAVIVLQASHGCVLTASILWLKGPNGNVTKADHTTVRYLKFVKEWEKQSGVSIMKDPVIRRYCK